MCEKKKKILEISGILASLQLKLLQSVEWTQRSAHCKNYTNTLVSI